MNLVALILEQEQEIVEQMNSLGTSAADNAKYDALKTDREELYKECVPILKSLIEIGANQGCCQNINEYIRYARR